MENITRDDVIDLVDCLGNSGYSYCYNGFIYLSVSYMDDATYFFKVDLDNSYGVHTVSSSDFYAYMKHTDPKDIVTYVRLVDDMKFVYIKDSYIHGANLSSYDPSEVSDIVNIFIDKVLSVKSVLECLRKIFSTYGIFIKC
ncbi:MAG: hypothetical protein ACLR3R_19840 [Clostridium paraputrificum]